MKFFIYNCFFISVVIIFAYFNTLTSQQSYTTHGHVEEAFTPKFRELYRPYTRNIRQISEGFYNKHTSTFSNLFRKYGII